MSRKSSSRTSKPNPVAKHAHRYNRCTRFKDATQYARREKHQQKARQNDFSGPSSFGLACGRQAGAA